MSSYTLIAYRPSNSVPACARGCCGYTNYDSSHSVERNLSRTTLVDKVARLKIEDEDYDGGVSYEVTYFPDEPYDRDWDDPGLEEEIHYRLAQLKQDARVAAEQKAQEDAAAEQKAAEEARLQAEKEQDEHDKAEYERLHRKFGLVD